MTIRTFGPHRVRHGNVMDEDGIASLMQGDTADIFYSDPPWGQGNLKYWSTMNKKMTGQEMEQPPLDDFLDRIFDLALDYTGSYLCIEYGCRWMDAIQQRAVTRGFKPLAVVDIQYRSGSKMLPLHLHVFSLNALPLPPGYVQSVHGTSGFDCISKAISPLADAVRISNPDPIILDPCCGMGYTAKCALDMGMSFRGNELNEKRLGKTIARFKKYQ